MTILLFQPSLKSGEPSTWLTPPRELMEYGEESSAHIAAGRMEYNHMFEVCKAAGVDLDLAWRVLDFGCSNGRVTRWFPASNGREVWGSDIQAPKVHWAQQHLGPPLRFLVNTIDPHLPFADGYFDFICAHSIFTHIQNMHVGWLMELCRLLSDRGSLFITLHDAKCLEAPRGQILRNHHFKNYERELSEIDKIGFLSVNEYKDGLAQVYMSEEYLRRISPPWLTVLGPFERAYSDLQSGYILTRKR